MPVPAGYLIDTNVLLRMTRETNPETRLIRRALTELDRQRQAFYFSLQNIAEFWNVCTRPSDRNGFGLSVPETDRAIQSIERTMTLLPDDAATYGAWRQLVITHNINGAQVHDARPAALMQVQGVQRILTFNKADFERYPHVTAIHPAEIG